LYGQELKEYSELMARGRPTTPNAA
jgi:hypothetical protein